MRDELVCRSLKEKSLASHLRLLVNDIDDLREAWDTLNTCFDRPDKYISEAVDPVIKFRSYKAFDSGAIREFYSLLRAAMMGARKAGLLGRLINDQTLPGILARMPPTDWRQWARERPNWMREATEGQEVEGEPLFRIAGRRRPPSLPGGCGSGSCDGDRWTTTSPGRWGPGVCIQGRDGMHGAHPPWLCKVFGKLPTKEREKLIIDNKLCPFCLLHDKDKLCGAKQRTVSVACMASGCKGRHAQKLHDFLKDVFREEGRVHVVQEDDEWEESEEAWELGEAEAMIVGTVKQETGYSWQDACDTWAVQNEEMEAGVHQVEVSGMMGEPAREDQCKKVNEAKKDSEQPEGRGLLVEGEEQEYFLELLMGKVVLGQSTNTPSPKVEANTLKGKKKRNLGKKLRKKLKLSKGTTHKEPRREREADPVGGEERQVASNLSHNPEAKGRGLASGGREKGGQTTASPSTSGGECSG